MRRYFFIVSILMLTLTGFGQKPKAGIYTYQYHDLEYDMQIGSCQIIIKQDSIFVYASKELAKRLTNLNAGQLIEAGLLLKHLSGRWIIAKNKNDATNPDIEAGEISYIDWKKKIYFSY